MEEIDIENIEDVNDLEARLYAQVHHEGLYEGSNSNSENNKGDCFTTVSKDLPRYWENQKPASTIPKNSIMSEQNSQRNTPHIVRNPFTLGGQQQLQPPTNKKGKVQNINDKLPNNPISKPKKTKRSNSLCLNPLAKPALRLNPAAAAAAARSKKGTKVDTINTSFGDRLQKIQKYKTLQNKRQKSNKINAAKKSENKNEDVVEIEIDSDAESDSSDVIIIPLPPPQVVTIDESDDEKLNKLNKSQDISPIKSAQVTNPVERQTHNSSPCCSILSSDDFIEQHDRSRLLANSSSNVADDADLLLLVAQVDNLTQTNKHSISKTAAKTANSTFPKEFVKIDDMDGNEDAPELNTIKKPSVINVIDSDSEMMENAAANSLPNRKRKMSTQHNERKTNNTILESDDDNEEEDDDEMSSGVRRTSISYIARGPAVEQRSVRKRIVTPEEGGRRRCRRKSSNTSAGVGECSGNMSDKEFITTLNHLIQGNDTEDDSDTESVPTARELAERVLSKRRKTTPTAMGEDAAIPESICENLNDVFQTIDQLNDKNNANRMENDSYIIEASATGSGEERPTITIDDDHDDVQLLIDDDDHEGDNTVSQAAKKYTVDGSPIYNVTFLERDCVPSVGAGVGWNDEMHKFYNSSWKGESFQLSRVLQEMDPDKSLWKIYSEDRFNKPLRRNLKCLNCCEFGHVRSKCKRPRKPLVCYMCGERGHREPRCPNTICLRCGNKTQVFMKSCNACTFQNRLICPICKVRGHSIDLCPDKWRRYHSTIEPNVFPKHGIEYNTKKYCYICGARGHLGENCRNSARFMEYPVIISSVKSHTKSYADLAIKSSFEIPQTGIGLNLMYKPSDGFNFDLAVNTEKDKVYGRFLTAVGMGSLLNRPTLETATISNDSNQNAPNQVQEVSESGSIAEEAYNNNETTDTTLQSNHLDEINDNESEEIVDIEPESSIIENIELHVDMGNTPTKNQNISSPSRISPTLQMIDSDSNYSFSEHFDVSSTSNTTLGENPTNITETNETKQTLDFIPLVNATKKNNNQDNNNKRKTKPHNEGEKNNSDNNKNPPCDEPLPCKAKIYLRNFHSKYLLSPEGRTFLNNLANNCKVQAGINFSSVGYVLIIYGLQAAQDEFHKHLLKKYDELDEQENSHNGNVLQNIPKRTDALIRFLRENIGQLLNNLGNVNELFRRMKYLEKQHSKSGSKMADKVRRLLNMILVGQGGLSDGKMHLDKLLVSLRCLMYDHLGEEVAPVQLRSTITEHWKMIFSPYRHSNYQQLVQTYNTLVSQHGFPTINVDPILLGRKSMQFTAEARQQSDAGNCSLPPSIGENQLNPQNVANPTFMSEDTTNQSIIPSYNSTDITLNVSNTCSQENRENQNVAKVTELNISSPFWSRECIQYLDRCIHKVSTQPHVIEKLQLVRNKSKRGELSYNDYLAVIKLHKTLLGK